MAADPGNGYIVQPVVKALRVLELVAEHGHDVSLTAVCKGTGIPKTSAFRYLQTLTATGFLEHDALRDRYGVGPRFRTIARADNSLNRLRQLAHPHMRSLVAEFSETVNLAIEADHQVVYVDVLEADRPLRIQARIGTRHPMHSTALGKAILAFLPPAEQQAYFDHPLTEMTGRTMVERQAIERQLRKAARIGYATESGENEDGAMCIGAPIFDAEHHPVAAISLSAPLQRAQPDLVARVADKLMEAARTISVRFGADL
jgi:IclR family acetate operon transcriptional repressor